MEHNLKEIVLRDPSAPLSQEECLFVIQQYVKIRKDIDITPNINERFGTIGTVRELNLMIQMSNFAINWLRDNRFNK